MKTTRDWLDEAKAKHDLSDYALAPKLGVSRAQMSRYRTGLDFLSESSAIKIAELLDIDPLPVLASAAAERTKSDDVRAVWTKYAEALASVAGALLLGTVLTAPDTSRASVLGDASLHKCDSLYIGANKRRKKRTRSVDPDSSGKTGDFLPGFFSAIGVHASP